MSAETEMPGITFAGSGPIQKAAERAFNVMRAHGMFMSDNAPIRVNKAELVAFLTESGISAADAESALSQNPEVFAFGTDPEGEAIVLTTRLGVPPVAVVEDVTHTMANRFTTPLPEPDKPAAPARERVSVDPSWATFTVPDFEIEEFEDDDFEIEIPFEAEIEPVAASTPEAVEAEAIPETPTNVEASVVEPAEVTPEAVATPEPDLVASAPAPAPEVEDEIVEAAAEEPEVVAEPEPEPMAAVETPVVEPDAKTAARPSVRPSTDFSGFEDAEIASAIEQGLDEDIHVARFGQQWMSEDRVQRLSRGELRRIREYIEEQEQPLTDEALVQDILGVRANNPDYARMLFSTNFRLSRERDFEFVGTNDQRFWSTTSLPAIGTDRRKHNDIGTDFRYLVDEVASDIEHRSVESVDHVVSFYEYTLGLLPYDAEMQELLPAPLTADQRTAVFTFEIPQTYTTYLVELRYPTPNRGGFLLGLDDFYADCVVPGAIISISATENDGHYKVEYLAADDQDDRLLELDDRRAGRYVFRPTTYSCVVDDKWLINEDRFPNLGSDKPLADKVRRRVDEVLKATFERIGLDDGENGLLASFEDLLAAVNIERPFSEAALRAALEADASVSGDDANGYTYVTGS